jgi:hypothetical protein
MRRICEECFHSSTEHSTGRQRVGCMRARSLPDGKTLSPPRNGWEAAIERLPQSPLDYRVKGDQCGPEARNFNPGSK